MRATSFRSGIRAIVFVGVCLLVFSSGPASASEITISYIDPPVKYRGPRDLTWSKLDESDTRLPREGDLLVGDGGALEMNYGETSTIRLNESTGVSLFRGRIGDTVRVNHGSTRLDVETNQLGDSSFRITTPNASMGIRGTEFGVSYERSKRSEVFVEEGSVAFESGRTTIPVKSGGYGRTREDESRSDRPIVLGDSLPSRYRLTWNRWDMEQSVRSLRRRRSRLESRKESLRDRLRPDSRSDTGRIRSRLSRIERRIDSLNRRISRVSGRFATLEEEYNAYRRRLEQERQDFIRRRRQAFDAFRRQRMKEFNRMKKEREEGMESMRMKRREALESMQE